MIETHLNRPTFPKRAIITAGMPYGDKALHFGHIGGVFVHADVFARFLKDRIGKENVIFVSGTDCYGAGIVANYQKQVEGQSFLGTIQDYVRKNHEKQAAVLKDYQVELSLYATSALDHSGEIHSEMSNHVFETLYRGGFLKKMSSPQFYDPEFETWLNGRQVMGKCPIDGCSSDKAYADECALGHQYMPNELIHPISTLSGKTPELREVANWYFDLERYQKPLQDFLRTFFVHR